MKWFFNWCSDMHDEYEDDPGSLFLAFIIILIVMSGVIPENSFPKKPLQNTQEVVVLHFD